jgi:CRP-like cAMP-binding protein
VSVTLDLFRNESDFKSISAGATLFAEGDAGDAMFVILEGEIELSIRGHHVATLGPGEIFGEMALVDSNPRVATAVAKTACKLIPVSQKRFLFMVQQTPYFALQIMKVMAERLRRMDERL